MLPFDGIDEISAYKNPDGTYEVTMFISGKDSKDRPAQFKIQLPRASIDTSMSLNDNGPDYKLIIKGENYCGF